MRAIELVYRLVRVAMVLCVVFACSKRSGRDKDVSFRIPKVIYNKGDKAAKQKIEGWILAAFSRLGLTEKILKNDKICSKHFVSGKPADLLEDRSL